MSNPGGPVALAARGDLVQAVVEFCRLLRHRGVRSHAASSQVALAALQEIDITRREDFRRALCIALVQRPEDFPLFNHLFYAYWSTQPAEARPPEGEDPQQAPAPDPNPEGEAPGGEADSGEGGGVEQRELGFELGPELEEEVQGLRAARHGAGGKRALPADPLEQAELERVARRLSAELATRPSRRRVTDPRGRDLDLRGMLRSSLRFGGLPVELKKRRRRIARTRLVLFCDVSRSMDAHASLFLDFAAAVLQRVWRVEVFLFASELARVTDLWLDRRWSELHRLVPGWGGGTQLGTSLQQFLRDYDRCLLGGSSIVMILSDGLDAGEPELVAANMERLRRRCRGVVWLNPLLHIEGYEPRARGMAAALPHLDAFLPAHDVKSLWRAVDALGALANRPREGLIGAAA